MWSLKLVDVHLVPASASHLLNTLMRSCVFSRALKGASYKKEVEVTLQNFCLQWW